MPGQTVRIIGKPLQLNGDTALIDSSGEIIVHLSRVSSVTHRSMNLLPKILSRCHSMFSYFAGLVAGLTLGLAFTSYECG